MGLLIGHGPLQGAGCVVEKVDAQLQVGLPRCQRRAEHGQLQPFAGFPACRCLQHTGVEAAEKDMMGTGTEEAGTPVHLPPGSHSPRSQGEQSRARVGGNWQGGRQVGG